MLGKKIWYNIVNEYVELTENCRFNNAELSIIANFYITHVLEIAK